MPSIIVNVESEGRRTKDELKNSVIYNGTEKFIMKKLQHNRPAGASAAIACRNGRIYFSARLERKVFFVLTLAMLAYGLLWKLGIV